MNEIMEMSLTYESLVPIPNPEDTFLSVGTVTFQDSAMELHLDFNETRTSYEKSQDSIVTFQTTLCNFEPNTFLDEYRANGLKPSDLNYDFFAARLKETYLTEVYTEYCYRNTRLFVPLTLKSAQLTFRDNRSLDYSDHISIFALDQLAEVA